ncbi:hypothetical protein SDC9_73394 [bioreactor metagenome]|uniref:Uncharacterized protein n=1 Tax=bioreactor metagenome TaxID=1076179 RepID=A0A644YEY3_9ZZZZ
MIDDKFQIVETAGNLIDAHHFFGTVEIDVAERVAHHECSLKLLVGSNSVFQIEDQSIGMMNTGVEKHGR